MKKRNFVTLAMIGIGVGMLIGGCQQSGNRPNRMSAAERMTPDMQSFYNSLSPQAQQKFMEMDAQHRMMAMQMAQQDCHGQNQCAGMGGCEGSGNCAGRNDCKGQGGGPIGDPNRAVDVQYNNQMDDQRSQMNDGMQQQYGGAPNSMRRGYGRSYKLN